MTLHLARASNGAAIQLAEELGQGGEGVVHRVANAPTLVAKIYFDPPDAGKVSKLSAMVRLAPPELLRIAAWPTELLRDESGAVRGFLMQRVTSREDAHELYSPKSRRQSFPEADFRFIVHVAANVARAFAQLHSLGHVIGDVNHGNALVGRDATVMLIDCDSFQVKDGEMNFACDVGVPLFTPPELQGQNFRGLMRSADHDAFGLAVLLFHFLYAGRHPFAGRQADGEMPIEQAIAESRFAYGPSASLRGTSPPPGTLALEAFGAPIAALFERAFLGPGTARPTAVEWIEALTRLESELVTCATIPDHDHPKAAACCWCEIESRTSMAFFGRTAHRAVQFFDVAELDRLWNDIQAVEAPLSFGQNHARVAKLMANHAVAKRSAWTFAWWFGYLLFAGLLLDNVSRRWLEETIFFCLGLGAFLFIVTRIRNRPTSQLLDEALRDAEERLSDLPFLRARGQLETARRRLLKINGNPGLFMEEAASIRHARDRERELNATTLNAPRAPALKASERAGLMSLGVFSAADVLHKRSQLHHALSYSMVRELIQWAESLGSSSAAANVSPLEPRELRAVEAALREEAKQLMSELRRGVALLRNAHEEVATSRRLALVELSNSEP